MKNTSLLNDIFTFKESEKILKKTTLGFLFAKEFNESEKKRKVTEKFGTGFKEHDQNFEISAQGLFPIYESAKNSQKHSLITKTF